MRLRRRLTMMLLAPCLSSLPLLLTGCGLSATQASTYQIQMAIYAPLCLEVKGGSTVEGEVVQTYPCADGAKHQEWSFVAVAGSSNLYQIVNANSGQCMTVSYGNTAPATPVVQAPCYVPIPTAQTWVYMPVPVLSKTAYNLVSSVGAMCLDIPYGQTTGSTAMQVYTCNKSADPAQGFVLNAVVVGVKP